jgi:putative tryptophan/tyrosine transport system substrate-binding protein
MQTMTKRKFMTTAGAASAVLLTRDLLAAQGAKMPRVGALWLGGPSPFSNAFLKGLADLGYIDGQNVTVEQRFAKGQLNLAPELATELIALEVDVIVAVGAVGARAAQELTKTIPIVFAAVLDPVALGFAVSLERPGGNVTGLISFDPEQPRKQFEILKEVVPNLTRVAILSDGDIPPGEGGWNPLEKVNDDAARSLGMQPQWVRLKGRPTADLEEAFRAMANERAQALLILEVPVTLRHLKQIAELAAKYRLPTMFPGGWPNEGLITYGTSILHTLPRVPVYVDKILKGAKAGELPIEVITRRELVVNLKTAMAIGITIPSELLKRADRVVE